MKEADFMRLMQRVASSLGARLFRQNTGMAWTSNKTEIIKMEKKVTVRPGDVVLRNARPFRSGFPGWSDLGGWKTVEITPDMVGSRFAQYVAAEIKVETKSTQDQADYLAAVIRAGGRAAVVKSEEDLHSLLR